MTVEVSLTLDGEEYEGTLDGSLTGELVSNTTSTEPTLTREHSYTIEATGSSPVQYYLEAEDGADFVASSIYSSDNSSGQYWISGDESKVAGEIPAGSKHAWEFNNFLLDVELTGGTYTAMVDGSTSDPSQFPLDAAAGDYWKYYFPWNIDTEPARANWYSIEATGAEKVVYYLEKDSEGNGFLPSENNSAIVEHDKYWIDPDGEDRVAGVVQPGDCHAFAFDGYLLDVTLEGGSAEALVNGSTSSLEHYPYSGATGDDWKHRELFRDNQTPPAPESTTSTSSSGGNVIGGGSGYDAIVTSNDAQYTVSTLTGLTDALANATTGETVYVSGSASIDLGGTTLDVPSGVTLASNRGQDGSSGALLYSNDDTVPEHISVNGDGARITGLRIRGAWAGETVTAPYDTAYESAHWGYGGIRVKANNVEVDNNEVSGMGKYGIQNTGFNSAGGEGDNHYHHNYIYDCNEAGYGYGIAAGFHGPENPTIEYNYFNNCRHAVTAGGNNYGYVCRYNHFGPKQVLHVIDVHDGDETPYGATYTLIEGNIVESLTRTWDDNCNHAIDGFDSTGGMDILDNWFWNDTCTYGYDPAAEDDITKSGNVLGNDGTTEFADIIPNHPGAAHRPWA